MRGYDLERRQFLKFLLFLPMAFTSGCGLERHKSIAYVYPLSPEESLKKLVILLGPWSANDKEKAEDFASRFLQSKHTVSPYLLRSSELVQSIASRFPAETMAMNEINLRNLSAKEQELLIKLVKQIHSFVEVRFYVSNEPPWGVCQSDRTRYTRAPMLGKI